MNAKLRSKYYKTIGPGPGSYNIEKITKYGKDGTPRYTMRPQILLKEEFKSPGPCSNDVHIKPFFKGTRAPQYSMGRVLPRQLIVRSPGPAKYGRTNLNVKLNKCPSFSMTGRNIYSFKPCGIAPNSYDISYHKPGRTTPAYSFGTRHSDFAPPMIVCCTCCA